jgi:diguanylate cyclase (GGDEF)-like protein/PAS domain S-box-containing protein
MRAPMTKPPHAVAPTPRRVPGGSLVPAFLGGGVAGLLLAAVIGGPDLLLPLAAAAAALGIAWVGFQVISARARARRAPAAPRQATSELSQAVLAGVAVSSSEVILVVGEDRRMRYVSPTVTTVFGIAVDDLLGEPMSDHLDAETVAWVEAGLEGPVVAMQSQRRRGRLRTGNTWRDIEATVHQLEDPERGVVLFVRDQTEREWLRAEVTYRSHHDPLTGLPNRGMFSDRVHAALTEARASRVDLAVAVLDLDHFKAVNDGVGHDAGDALIAEIGRRLSETPVDMVARLGGDEFAVLFTDLEGGPAEARRRIEEIVGRLSMPFMVGDRSIFTRMSAGIALAREGTDSAAELLRKADIALYNAKERGKDGVVLFDPSMHMAAVEELALHVDLEGGMRRGEFVLSYQPVVELWSGRPVATEALLRWRHPQRGLLGPDTFIPLAERSGLIVPLGRWVLQEACRQLAAWDVPNLTMNVNLSARQFQYASLADEVADAAAAAGISPRRLTLEVTESLLLGHDDSTNHLLRRLKALGASLAIDDFGTGYSSFGYLRERMVDVVKIDRSFIEGVGGGPEDAALAQAILKLSHGLGLRAVAEGIEQVAQVRQLRAWACDYGQGNYFAPPLDADGFAAYLHGWERSELTLS